MQQFLTRVRIGAIATVAVLVTAVCVGCAGAQSDASRATTKPAIVRQAPLTSAPFDLSPADDDYIRANVDRWVRHKLGGRAVDVIPPVGLAAERMSNGDERVFVLGQLEGVNVLGARMVKEFSLHLVRDRQTGLFEPDSKPVSTWP